MNRSKYFRPEEFDCSHTGKNEINPDFVEKLDELRALCGFPFVITSGYRDKTHPAEAKKVVPGWHNQGVAADIKVRNGSERRVLVDAALEMGFNGIGVGKDFVHIDDRSSEPVMWTYGT